MIFPSQFKFDENFIFLSSKFYSSDPYNILNMTQQLCCYGMCQKFVSASWSGNELQPKKKISIQFELWLKIHGEMGSDHREVHDECITLMWRLSCILADCVEMAAI